MLAAVLAVAALICAVGWLMEHISLLAALWYIEEKKIPFPSDEEMRRGTRWAVQHFMKGLHWRSKR